ncbi:MAG: FAD-binding protein [Planctomycetes bacterium]|nr:FAD-binding protein [Planctomycetota bacterium]
MNEPQTMARALKCQIQGDVFEDILHRVAFSTDASIYRIVPACVVVPRCAADVVAVVKYAAQEGIPVAPRGAGSGVAGESLCAGIVLDMTQHLTRIEVHDQGETVTCQPGAVLDQVNAALAPFGRTIGPDPSSGNRATIGGSVANNATGAHSLIYGHLDRYVTRMEVVTSDGQLMQVTDHMPSGTSRLTRLCHDLLCANVNTIQEAQPQSPRTRSGYTVSEVCQGDTLNLARLLTGSEGTLGIFTEITLRTVPVPRCKALVQFEFSDLQAMARAVPLIVQQKPGACELMDRRLMDMALEALPQYHDIFPKNAAALLLVEHTGDTPDAVKAHIARTIQAVGNRSSHVREVFDPADQARLWKSRKDAVPLLYRQRGTAHPVGFIEDVSVEHTRLGDYVAGLETLSKRHGVTMSYYGHAGDGELHVRPFLDLNNPDHVQTMRSLTDDVFALAWSLGGSISGEHGEGLLRAAYVKQQFGGAYTALLCHIKALFDPKHILNPGKILNDDPDIMVKNLRRAPDLLPERLTSDLQFDTDELAHELLLCNGCGLCRTRQDSLRLCPVFRALGDELATPRAKVTILDFWATGQLNDKVTESPAFRQYLDLCINCKACLQQCPSRVDVSKLMSAARARYVNRKGLRTAELALSHNRLLSLAGSGVAPLANCVAPWSVTGWGLEKVLGLDRSRSLPRFEQGSFLSAGQAYLDALPPVQNPVDRVCYFVDTYANSNDHDLGFAVLDVLRANHIEVILPAQRPAPLPAICYGHSKRARKDLEFNVRHLAPWVDQGYRVVCSEPSAALALKEDMRHFVTSGEARAVSSATVELMNYLYSLHSQGTLKPCHAEPESFVYHSPCHLTSVGHKASLPLLAALCQSKITDLNAGCCGLSGTFGMQKKNKDLSQAMAAGLKAALEASSGQTVLTECAACKMQIEHLADPCRVVLHPIKILAKAYTSQRPEGQG